MSELYISMYHYTRDLKHSRYPEIKGLDVNLFREQIAFMKSNFNIVTIEQVLEAISTKEKLPEKALLLTFDDGYADNYTEDAKQKAFAQDVRLINGTDFARMILEVGLKHFE